MNSSKRRSQRDYTLAFKLSVVDQIEKGELSYKEAQRRYGIQGRHLSGFPIRFRGRILPPYKRSPSSLKAWTWLF